MFAAILIGLELSHVYRIADKFSDKGLALCMITESTYWKASTPQRGVKQQRLASVASKAASPVIKEMILTFLPAEHICL